MKRILVVEDSVTQAEGARLILEDGGFAVEIARDGEEGRERAAGSTFDLVVSDVLMPRLSGYELCRWLKGNEGTRSVPVILLTTLNDPMDIVQALEAGADNFISKPYEPAFLLARVRDILESNRLVGAGKLSVNVEMQFLGRRLSIGSGKEQILSLLLSAFEDMVRTNRRLLATQAELRDAQERLEERAHASEEMYGTLMREASDSILLLDQDGLIVEANRQACALLGLAAPDVVGRAAVDLLTPAPGSASLLLQDLVGKDGSSADFLVHRSDGRTLETEASASLVGVQGRRVVFALLRDVTERRRAEAAATAQQQVTRILAEAPTLRDAAQPLLTSICGLLRSGFGVLWQIHRETGALTRLAISSAPAGEGRDAECTSPLTTLGTWLRDPATGNSGTSSRAPGWLEVPAGADGVELAVLEVRLAGSGAPEDELLKRIEAFGSQIGQFIQRREAEAARRTSEKRFRRLFESNTIGIAITDIGGRILEANGACLEILGRTQEELLDGTLRWNEMTPLEWRDRDQAAALELRTTGVARPWEKELRRRDGSRVPVLVGVALLEEEQETSLTYLVDLTERKRTEEATRRLLHAVEQVGNVIVMTSPSGEITYVNPAFEATYGFTREEALGKTPRILKSGCHDDAFYRRLWAGLLSGEGFRSEIVNKTRDGRLLTVEMSAKPVLDTDGKRTGFISVQNDVTARKQLEEQLRFSQKMEAVGQLAGGVAHDFNNMLTAVLGYSDLLDASPGLTPDQQASVAEIRNAATRAAALTRQLLAFSRKQILQPVVLCPNDLIRNLEGMLRRLVGEDLAFTTQLGDAVGRVSADPGQLEQVVLNLVVNARDAMPRGGRLTIETTNSGGGEEPGSPVAPSVMIAVSDTGIGMDAALQSRIFEPFFTTKEPGKGTGLGLSTVHGIVQQSGGTIGVASEPGKGTTFRVFLPRVDDALPSIEPPSGRRLSERGSETILLVEDEPSIRKLVREILRSNGYRVLEAASGPEALQLARESLPIHLLLSDLVMPEMQGPELATKLLELTPGTRILFMSGYSNDAVARHGVLGDSGHFIQKPFTASALLGKVREALLARTEPQGQRP